MRLERGQLASPLVLSAVVCLVALIATFPLPHADQHLVGSDGLRYFAILRSAVFDHDLDFSNDYPLLGVPVEERTPIGRPANPFSVGPALLWAPFYLIGCALAAALHAAGASVPITGVGPLYEAPVCLASAAYAGLGFLWTERLVRSYGGISSPDATRAALAMLWATPAVYYVVAEPSMSHALSVFTNAVFIAAWLPGCGVLSWRRMARIGFAGSLVGLVRWQDSVVLGLPAAELIAAIAPGRLTLRRGAGFFALLVATFALGMVPQFVMWRAVYGSSVLVPQGTDFMHWLAPHPLEALFSTRHGLVTWHPIFAASILGMFAAPRGQRGLALAVGALFVCFLYVNSAVGHWWADDAFGGRRFVSLIPWLTFPTAWALAWVRARSWSRAGLLVLVVLVLWNGLAFVQYRLGLVSRDAALTWRELTLDRLLLPFRVRGAPRSLRPRGG